MEKRVVRRVDGIRERVAGPMRRGRMRVGEVRGGFWRLGVGSRLVLSILHSYAVHRNIEGELKKRKLVGERASQRERGAGGEAAPAKIQKVVER